MILKKKKIQSKFDNSKRKGPQEIFRMIESSNFRESSENRKCSVIFIQTMVWSDLTASIRHFGAYMRICAHGMKKMCLLEFYHNVIYDQQIKTNAKQKRLTRFIKSCQQRKVVEYKTMNHLLTKYLTYKNEHELANIVK